MFIQALKDVFALARFAKAQQSPVSAKVQYIGKHGILYARQGR